MKTKGFCTVFITDMNSAGKKYLVSVYLWNSIEGTISANFIKDYSLRFSRFSQKFENF